jgi:enoyl-CoA hydratase/carnithine racemase
VAEGKLVPRKGKELKDLPDEWQKIKALFSDENIEGWLSGKYLESDDPIAAKAAKMIAKKAPTALRLANQIVDDGYELPLKEAVKEELAHLEEIFSTEDALTGLKSVGKGRPTFEGK